MIIPVIKIALLFTVYKYNQQVNKTILMNQPLPVEGTDEIPKQKKYSLLRVLHKCFGVQFYSIGVLKLVGDGLGFAGPLLLHELVTFIENKDGDTITGYTYAGGLCGAALVGECFIFVFLFYIFFFSSLFCMSVLH